MITIECKGKLIAVLQELGYSKKRAQERIKLLERKDNKFQTMKLKKSTTKAVAKNKKEKG